MEILNVTSDFSGWGVLGAFMIVGGIAVCMFLMMYFHRVGSIIAGTVALCGVVLLVFSGTIWKEPMYEVLIDGDSGYEYLMENYDVVEQRGKIWIVKEKRD